MKYWQFVNWEPAPLEGALKSRVAVAIAAYENGDKNAIKEYYRQFATVETLQNPVVKIGGWAFSLREFCRVYWVKVRHLCRIGAVSCSKNCRGCVKEV